MQCSRLSQSDARLFRCCFHPNIYKRDEILKQEGWHYEIADKDDELKFNGVVYNEMKGVFSSADDVLARKIQEALLKDTQLCFGVSGDLDDLVNLPERSFESFAANIIIHQTVIFICMETWILQESLLLLTKNI